MLNNYPTKQILIMAGGITPKAQPMDKIINNMWKGCFSDEYDGFILTDHVNEKTR